MAPIPKQVGISEEMATTARAMVDMRQGFTQPHERTQGSATKPAAPNAEVRASPEEQPRR